MGMTADLARGALLTLVALLVFVPARRLALAQWSGDPRISRGVVVAAAAAVAGAAAWKVFHATPGARWLFLCGLAGGLTVLALR